MTAIPNRRPKRAIAAVTVMVFLWGSMPTVLKHFTGHLDAMTMIGFRLSVSGFFWLPIVMWGWRTGRIPPAVAKVAVLPAAAFLIGQVLWSMAPYHSDASILMFIGRSAFVFAMIFGFWLVHEERKLLRRPRFWMGVAASAVGMTILFFSAYRVGATSVTGFTIMLVTAVFWGLHGPLIRRFMVEISAPLGFGLIAVYMLPCVLIILFWKGSPQDVLALSTPNLWLLIASSLLPMAIGQALGVYAFQTLGPIAVEGGYMSMPFISAVIAFIFLGDAMTPLQWAAGTVVIVGSVLLLSTKAKNV